MFNKTVFKHTFKSNIKMWTIITVVLSIMNAVMIAVFEPSTISSLSDMVKDTPISNLLADTSFLGMLGQTFYSMHGIILPLIYIIVVANNLIVSQVDRGSMAYILSTPIKRIAVVITQAIYFIISLFTMILISTLVGLVAIQGFHGGVWGVNYTKDVKAASKVLNIDKEDVNNDLNLILNNEEALKEGAKARDIDEDVYKIYLNLKLTENSYKKASEIMNIDEEKISEDPSIIKDNQEALKAGANVMDMSKEEYSAYLDQLSAGKQQSSQSSEMQDKIFKGISASAKVLGLDESELASDMSQIKSNEKALDKAVKESGIPKEMFISIIDNQIASKEIALDEGLDFDVNHYMMLNIGLFLLLFATSGVSFMFSCIFNLSKNYMAFGAGIPLVFFLFDMMKQVSPDLEIVKYFTINSLFDTETIINGGDYILQFVALGAIGIVLYGIGVYVFKRKDLPL